MGYGLWSRSPAFGCRFPIFYFPNFFFSAACLGRFCAFCAFCGGSKIELGLNLIAALARRRPREAALAKHEAANDDRGHHSGQIGN